MQDNQESGHFSQEELDAIVSGGVTPKLPTDFGTPPQEEPERPIWDTADAVMAVPRGVVGFGKSVWNLADWASFDLLPDWHTNPLGTSKSTVGGFVEGISQIAAGFGAGGLALKAATKIPGAVGAASAWLSGAGGGAAGVVRGGLTKGAIADFISFEGNAGRLSDLLVETDNPALNNAVTQYLATDMEDGELEGRLKNALEGAVLGVALEGVIAGIKGSAKAVKTYRAAKAVGASEEAAVKAATDVAGAELKEAEELLSRAEDEAVMASPDSVARSMDEVTPDPAPAATDASTDAAAASDAPGVTTRGSGGPNYGVDRARKLKTPAASSAAVRELEDLINTGAGVESVAAKIEELRAARVINLRPVTKDGSPGAYAEALIAINQAEGNLDSFGPASPKGSNKLAQQQAAANVNAAIESGGLNAAEVNKVMADGVASAVELNRRLPFLLGLESAMRYEALQALRSGRADTDQMIQVFTSVAGASRRVKSYLGKNLQMIQAFGDWESIMRSYEQLNPSQQAALQERYADVLELLVVDPQTGREAARVLTDKITSKGFRIGAEMFRNSILSGPKTLIVNVASALEALFLPLERSAGRMLAGQGTQAAKELSTMARYMGESRDAFQALKLSLKEEGDSITLGRGNTQFGEFQPQRAISSKNFARLNAFDPATGGSARTVPGLAVDFVGQVVGLPMRFMGSSDEFFTTLMARAESDVVLRRIVAQDRKLPMTSVQVSTEVERLKKLLFVDGQLYTRRTTLERGMRLARDKYLPAAFRETLEESVAAAKGLDAKDPAVQAEVSRLYSQAVEGGKVKAVGDLRKSKDSDVLLKSLDAAGRKSRANPMFIPEVQRFVDQNWDAYVDEDFMGAGLGANLQGQTGQDYKILQKASSEIERRVREATWKREYDDMAESSVYGTRLVGNIGKATASAVSHVPALQLVVPFIRTPTNLLAFVTDRNPVGRLYDWVQAARAGDKEAVAEATGRLATGTLLYTTGIALAANGMVTGRGPKDPELRKQLLASGWMPYSFRFGDTYVSYGRNDPIATFLGLVADTFEIASNTYDPSPEDQDAVMQIATAVIGSVANNVTNKSYLRGIVTTLGALTGDENDFKRLQRQYAGAIVPNVFAQAETYGMDPDVREVRSMMDAIRARLPGYGDSVDKVRNALGEPLKGNEGWGSMFLPGTASSRTKDPVKRELADSLISVGAPRSTLPGGIDLRAIKLKNGQSAYDRLQELTGQMRINGKSVKDQLASLIQSPFYRQLPQMGQDNLDSPRVSLVRGYVSNYRRAAMQQLMQESPELARAVAHSREVKASMLR
jgi:hypothetical protein